MAPPPVTDFGGGSLPGLWRMAEWCRSVGAIIFGSNPADLAQPRDDGRRTPPPPIPHIHTAPRHRRSVRL